MNRKLSIGYTLMAVLAIFGATLYFSSCQPDACVTRATVCKNNGTCLDGDCICALGYEGDSCQFTVNHKFESYYACAKAVLVDDTPPQQENDDTLRLVRIPNDKFGLTIFSVRDSIFERVKAQVSGNYITVPQQDVDIMGDIYRFYGTGSLNDGWLTLNIFREFYDFNNVLLMKEKRTYVGQSYEQ